MVYLDYITRHIFFTLYITIHKCIRRNPLNESYIKPIKERGNLMRLAFIVHQAINKVLKVLSHHQCHPLPHIRIGIKDPFYTLQYKFVHINSL